MKVLVTGGSGLVGRHVVNILANDFDVTSIDLVSPSYPTVPFIQGDVLDLEALIGKTKGFDAVVHLAGIPHPLDKPAERVFRVNVMGTWNMLEAAHKNGIRKFVLMSSESTLGITFSSTRHWPEYVPVDENHPLSPEDPYGLSKVTCELLCAGMSRKSSIHTTCLRSPWIWVPEEKEVEMYQSLVTEYRKWPKNLWAYVHVADVAQAMRLALTNEGSASHDVFFICANENWTGIESRQLLKEYYPETTMIAKDFSGMQSLISNAKAKHILGFSPKFDRTHILKSAQ